MIPKQLYKRFEGLKLFANGHDFELEYDDKRRCFRIYQKGRVFRDQSIDLKTEQYLKQGLEGKECYFEKINKSSPMNSYMLLDARAVYSLIEDSLIKTPAVTIKGEDQKREIEIKKIKKETKIGNQEIRYLIPNSINLNQEENDNNKEDKIKKRECIYKKPYFEKNHILLNKEMGNLIQKNAEKLDNENITLFGKKCKIEQDGKNYKLFQIDKKGKKENLDPNLFVMASSLRINPVSEEGYGKKYKSINEEMWHKKYADKFENKFNVGNEEDFKNLARDEHVEQSNIIKELSRTLNSDILSEESIELFKKLFKELSEKKISQKEAEEKLEKKLGKSTKKLLKNLLKELLEKTILQQEVEEKLEKKLEGKLSKELEGCRIWKNKDNHYKTCIDNENNIFISTYPNERNKIAFIKYLEGDAYLRRKESLALPVIPVWRRGFELNDGSESKLKIIIDGGDDTANGVVNSGAPEKLAAAVQGLLLFPAFLSFVKIGIDGLAGEKADTREELQEIKSKIAACEKMLQDFVQDPADASSEKIGEIFASIKDLKNSLKDLNITKIESKSSARFGHPAMISMFSAVAAYEIEAIFKLFGGIDGLTKGVGQFPFFTGLKTQGDASITTAELMKVGGLNIFGNSLAFM